jgi:murein DD-endopeptidase MepM/ murein hydrolase activator NlpD
MKSLRVSKPLKDLKITSHYGLRSLDGKMQFHDGIDLISTSGNNLVYSIFDGIVCYDFDFYNHALRFKDKKHSAGNYVIIKSIIDNDIFYIRYLHLIENFVTINQMIDSGQTIGKYGDVGYSFGAHLHIDMFNRNWEKIDVESFLKKYEVL